MPHSHSQGSQHDHPPLSGKNLLYSILLNTGITVAQVIGGLISGSLSLLSDALHNFTDVVSLIISYFANYLSKKDASRHRTFGYKRAEIVAAFINASSLMVISVLLIYNAIDRFFNPQEIEAGLVIWLAILAIAGNAFSVFLLKNDRKENLNMQSAYLHLLTDTLASVAVLIGGLLMKYYGIFWIDSLLTAGIAIYLIVVGYDLLKSSFHVLMLFSPTDIPVEKINSSILALPEIRNVHHVHIWQLNENEIHLEAHIDFQENINLKEFESVLEKIEAIVWKDFGINHVNIQPEFDRCDNKEIIVQD
ncbi:MAG TPA: cation diffusion facilitator family transporter [Flavobacteriaceae bacterium]|nr:cation diffusion facilitator family transporter [Flavobacteriaceae bacterium]